MAKEDVQPQAVVADPAPNVASIAAPDPTAAHGILSEIEAKLRMLKDGIIAWDHRELAKLHALVSKLRAHL